MEKLKNDPAPEKPRIDVDPDACGQQNYWPGDGLLHPGEIKDGKETTKLPIVPNDGGPRN
jgi:hypothetical protein